VALWENRDNQGTVLRALVQRLFLECQHADPDLKKGWRRLGYLRRPPPPARPGDEAPGAGQPGRTPGGACARKLRSQNWWTASGASPEEFPKLQKRALSWAAWRNNLIKCENRWQKIKYSTSAGRASPLARQEHPPLSSPETCYRTFFPAEGLWRHNRPRRRRGVRGGWVAERFFNVSSVEAAIGHKRIARFARLAVLCRTKEKIPRRLLGGRQLTH